MTEHTIPDRGIVYRKNTHLPGRPALVCIHGLSGSASAWARYEERFLLTHNLLVIDLRGHGRSLKYRTLADYALPLLADDVYAAMVHASIPRATVVSHSFGTLVALCLTQSHPDVVTSLILLSPNAYLKDTARTWYIRPLLSLLVGLYTHLPGTPRIRGRVEYSRWGYTSDWDLTRVYQDLRMTGLRAYLYCLKQAYLFDDAPAWQALSTRAVILHGTRDSYIPYSHAKRLAEELPAARLIPLEGANHIIVLNNFDDVAQAIAHEAS